LWILDAQTGSPGLIAGLAASLALAFALWAYGKSQNSSGAGIAWLGVAALALAGMAWSVTRIEAAPAGAARVEAGALQYQPYSEARVAELRAAGRPVFINATADWCITCLVNERVALETETVASAFKARNVAALKADWTRRDAAIAALLSRHGRQGVPLYLYFAPGADKAVILPQLLTTDIVLSALGPGR
jgi:thiol:disulfide interchange protein DsbD